MQRVLKLGAVNVVTQPHSPERYLDLFQRVRRRQKAARVRGDRFGLLTTLAGAETALNNPAGFVNGWIACFTLINQDGEWVDLRTGRPAADEELAQIQIPESLHPNPSYHLYRFYPHDHLFVFEIGNQGNKLTPNNATKLLKGLVSTAPLVREFGDVVITPMPSKETVSSILNSTAVRELLLVMHAPNPPVGREAEREVMRRLESRRLKKEEHRFVAKPKEAVQFDEALQQDTRIAARNGHAEARVLRAGRVERISTLDTPYVYSHSYSDDVTTREAAFRDAADAVRAQLMEQ